MAAAAVPNGRGRNYLRGKESGRRRAALPHGGRRDPLGSARFNPEVILPRAALRQRRRDCACAATSRYPRTWPRGTGARRDGGDQTEGQQSSNTELKQRDSRA